MANFNFYLQYILHKYGYVHVRLLYTLVQNDFCDTTLHILLSFLDKLKVKLR